jgi:glycosyltransferase involved in cell wall biosynthesis
VKVVHFSMSDSDGGAARAAYRLHAALRRAGCDSTMIVSDRRTTDPTVVRYVPPRDLRRRLGRVLRRFRIAADYRPYDRALHGGESCFHEDRAEPGRDLLGLVPPCDVLHLHWVAAFVDVRAFFGAFGGKVPIVWTLHDMHPFTGGCHYDDGCGRFADSCGRCPQLGSRGRRDLSRAVWRRRRRAYATCGDDMLRVVTPSRWLEGDAKRSSLLGRFAARTIPNGLDTDRMQPRDRRMARRALDVPPDARVAMFAAASIGARRKGFHLLREAVGHLRDPAGLLLLSMGEGRPDLPRHVNHLHVGSIQDERIVSLVYSAADVFVAPSVQDNLPNTVMEAMACGTPVIAFDVGGMADMVRPGSTGVLVPSGDAAALRAAMEKLLADPDELARLGRNCRQAAVREYACQVQASRYIELYESLHSKAAASARTR